MGQYHLTVNLSKREFLDPHKLGDGLKLAEQANSTGGVSGPVPAPTTATAIAYAST